GSYRLVRFIGAGGMGEVYEAHHTTLGTRQAIKFLRGDMVRRVDLVARFEQEARIADTLHSRHIIKVRELGRLQDGTPYMVMDLAEGRSLAKILAEQGRFEVARAVDLVQQACVGLRVAHDAKIIHRDLKPENLYVCSEDDSTETLKILDFGIAKHLGAGDQGPTTETGSNLGTAHYMSPEQAQGAKRAIDHRTDIYSLGVILYEMLSGTKPHDGESYNEILIRIVTQSPVPLDALCPDLPAGLIAVVRRAMAREPAQRYQSAFEFANALATLGACHIECTDLGPALRPAARPRSSAMVTLASGSEDSSATAPEDAALPARERLWPSSLARQVFRSIVAVGAVAAAALALRGASTDTRTPSIGYGAQPTSPLLLRQDSKRGETPPHAGTGERLPGQVSAGGARPARQATLLTPEVPTSLPVAFAKSSSRTSTGGQHAGQPKVIRPSRSVRPKRTRATPRPADEGSPTRPPTIDEPLPRSPHAPGVSPVME
ncbi:MAG: protein kinase, partial [Polyangiaceae bacterium]|nr:protein kinase [Polyangiaceae bacterium]